MTDLVAESPIGQVRGTRDWLPNDFARLTELERRILDQFARAGYAAMRTPSLELTELHERKSGAGIVAKLYELANAHQGRLCLRPELTASIVRAYTAADEPPAMPWRVATTGPVFRYETPQPGHYREFQQVGIELLGASGPAADGEIIWLADRALREAGIEGATIRLGHVGLLLELLRRSGLPTAAQSMLVEMLSEAAAEGRNVRALEAGIGQLAQWLQSSDPGEIPLAVEGADDGGIDRLFRTLVPVVTGRRSGHEILHRLRRKWDLSHSLLGVLDRVRAQIHDLADLRGPAEAILNRLRHDFEEIAPESVGSLRALVDVLGDYGVDTSRVEIDLGFGRGIGFYTQMVFELIAPTSSGAIEVCGGGRYDGLARVLGSPRDDRGVGFAFGLERLLHVLDAQGQSRPVKPKPRGCLVIAETTAALSRAVRMLTTLRASNEGRWRDDGPLILGIDLSAEEAQAYGRELNVASIALIRAETTPDEQLDRYDWIDGSWRLARREGGSCS